MPPKDKKIPLLGLPNELLIRLPEDAGDLTYINETKKLPEPTPEQADAVAYNESTLIMARLAQVNKRLHNLFQSELDKRAAKQLLEYVLKGEFAKAKKMYEANPSLLFIKVTDEVEEYAAGITTRINEAGVEEPVAVHRKVKGLSPFRAALAAGDKWMLEDMAAHFDKVVDTEGKPIGRKLAEQQFVEQFPGGVVTYPERTYDFSALVSAITNDQELIETGNPNERTKAALLAFKNHFMPRVVTQGHLFNLNDLIKACEVYDANWAPWNGNQLSLFWCQVVGGLELSAAAVDAQILCQRELLNTPDGLHPLERNFEVFNYLTNSTVQYFPLDLNSSSLLGRDFGVVNYGGGGVAGDGRLPVCRRIIEKLCRAKTSGLDNFKQHFEQPARRTERQPASRCVIL